MAEASMVLTKIEAIEIDNAEKNPFEDNVYKDEIVSMVKSEFERRRQERMPFELQWQLNINFINGNQYCDISAQQLNITEIPKLYWYQERNVFNHIAPIVETRKAKLGKVIPALKTRPESADTKDIGRSKIETAILRGIYNTLSMDDIIKNAMGWSEALGTVFYKVRWNASAGYQIGTDENGEPVYEGDIETVVVPPFEIFPDSSYSENLKDCRSIIHAKPLHRDAIKDIYGIEVTGRSVDVFMMTNSVAGGVGGLGYTTSARYFTKTQKEDHEIVIEYYELPTKRFPNGRLIVVIDNELAHYGELPYENDEYRRRTYPFVKQVCTRREGCMWGVSVVERLIPIQRSYNAVKNRKQEYLNRAAIGMLIEEENSIINSKELDELGFSPGLRIKVAKNARNMPRMMETSALSPAFYDEENKLLDQFILISGVSEISRTSTAPTGSGSGVALDILTRQDDTRISMAAEYMRKAVVEVGKQWLRVLKQFVVGKRLLRYGGDDVDIHVLEWSRDDLVSDNVVVESENALLQSPSQRRQLVIDLATMGLLKDPKTGLIDKRMRNKILEMLDVGDWENSNDIDMFQIASAQRENILLEKGVLPVVRDYHDHDLHIAEHDKFRLSMEFDDIINKSPELAEIMNRHVAEHKQAKAAEIQQQIANMQQAAGIGSETIIAGTGGGIPISGGEIQERLSTTPEPPPVSNPEYLQDPMAPPSSSSEG